MLLRAPAVVLSLAAVALVSLHAPAARAGCSIDCISVESTGFTITPALPCLEQDGPVDDDTCSCVSTLSVINRCTAAVAIRNVDESSCSSSPCPATTVGPGESTKLSVYVPTPGPRERGAPRDEEASAVYEVSFAGEASTYRLELGATARIDPEASACSAAPNRPRRRDVPVVVWGVLALTFVGLARRRLRTI